MRKIKRNSLCPCGSGKKYKYCCLRNEQEFRADEVVALRDKLGWTGKQRLDAYWRHIDGNKKV